MSGWVWMGPDGRVQLFKAAAAAAAWEAGGEGEAGTPLASRSRQTISW